MNNEAINLILAACVVGAAIYVAVVWRHPYAAEWLAVRLMARAAAKLAGDEEYKRVYRRAMGELTGAEYKARGYQAKLVELERRVGE